MHCEGISLLERWNRRTFLQGALASAGGLLLGCGGGGGDGEGSGGADPGPTPQCPNAFAGGQQVDELAFANEDAIAFGTPIGDGLDGRLFYDLSQLTSGALITPNELFYVRTRRSDLLDPTLPWQIDVSGLVDAPRSLLLSDIEPLVRPMGAQLLECSGNTRGSKFGLLSACEWSGAPMADVLARVGVRADATRVLVSGFDEYSQSSADGSTPGASWIFTFAELEAAGAFLATVMNGEPLPPDHGAPVRLFVPGWFGCTCIKWVNHIVLVDDTAPATSQMREFAARTHQIGVPALAADYAPAKIQQAAMPVRVEKWNVSGALLYRVVGILWGGDAPTERLQITFGDGVWQPVEVCPPHVQNATWTLWTYAWRPMQTGTFTVSLRVDDPNVPQIRLDSGWYDRVVTVDEV
jgi:DMSO/TMAO reductase YedYZ molybdopterin-dependent catalytic subunit